MKNDTTQPNPYIGGDARGSSGNIAGSQQRITTHMEQQRQEQEPVGRVFRLFTDRLGEYFLDVSVDKSKVKDGDKLYTTPPDQSKLIESQASEIAELQRELKVINQLYKDACENSYNFGELQAHINVLREALVKVRSSNVDSENYKWITEALTSTVVKGINNYE